MSTHDKIETVGQASGCEDAQGSVVWDLGVSERQRVIESVEE